MFENVIGSLVAAVICKVTKRAYEWLSELKRQAQNIKDKQQQEEFQKRIEEAERELANIQEGIAIKTRKVLSEPLGKIFAVSTIRSVLEGANAIRKKGATDQDVVNINSDLGSVHIRRTIRQLAEPLSFGQEGGNITDLTTSINSITQKMKENYEIHDGQWYREVAQFLQWCDELEDMLIRFIEGEIENV